MSKIKITSIEQLPTAYRVETDDGPDDNVFIRLSEEDWFCGEWGDLERLNSPEVFTWFEKLFQEFQEAKKAKREGIEPQMNADERGLKRSGLTIPLDSKRVKELMKRHQWMPANGAGAFMAQARKNVDKWGMQDLNTLGLAAAEELGEVCQAILQAKHEGGDPERIRDEAVDLGALCLQIIAAYEEQYVNGGEA